MGMYTFRVRPDGVSEWVDAPTFGGHAGTTYEADGAYVTYPAEGEIIRVRLAGYVHPMFSGTLPPPIPVQPVPPTPPATVDAEARIVADRVRKGLIAAEARIAALEARPAATGGGLTAQQVKDHIWSFAPDAIYADLSHPESGIRGQVAAIVKASLPTAAPVLDRAAIKAIVREVLIELLTAGE